jgi:hypothetical protein
LRPNAAPRKRRNDEDACGKLHQRQQ